MKLLRSFACRLAGVRGNVYKATIMGEAVMEEPSDAGSIPASSILYHEEGPSEAGRSPDDARRAHPNEVRILMALLRYIS